MNNSDVIHANNLDDMDDYTGYLGATMLGSDGEKIGKVTEIWVDNAHRLPEWAVVKTGLLRTRFVPLRAADFGDGQVTVAYTADEVEEAPDFDPQTARREDETNLYRHYRQPLPVAGPPDVYNPFGHLRPAELPE